MALTVDVCGLERPPRPAELLLLLSQPENCAGVPRGGGGVHGREALCCRLCRPLFCLIVWPIGSADALAHRGWLSGLESGVRLASPASWLASPTAAKGGGAAAGGRYCRRVCGCSERCTEICKQWSGGPGPGKLGSGGCVRALCAEALPAAPIIPAGMACSSAFIASSIRRVQHAPVGREEPGCMGCGKVARAAR